MTSELRVYGLRSKSRLIKVILLWVLTTGSLTRWRKMLPAGSSKQPQSHRQRFLRETLSTLPCAGGATQQSTDSLGCSLESIDGNFLSQVVEDPTRNGEPLNLILVASPSWSCEVRGSLGCSDHENVDLWRKEERRK